MRVEVTSVAPCCRELAPVNAMGVGMSQSHRLILVIFLVLAAVSCFGQLTISVRVGPPNIAGLSATDVSGRWLYLDSGLLGVERR